MFIWLVSWLLTLFIASFLLLVIWAQISLGICKSKKQLKNKVVVVTGASAGIGMEAARDLAARGARVIMACRNKEKGEKVLNDIKQTVASANVELMILDLGSLKSVRDFAAKLHSTVDKVDILLNNAGVIPSADVHLSQDGLDPVIQTNHLGHFLLTHLIKDLIVMGEDKRIVNVSSGAAGESPPIDFSQLRKDVEYDRNSSYAVSKLMNVLFSKEIARRWVDEGISSFSLHPGLVRTEIFSKGEMSRFQIFRKNKIVWETMKMIGKFLLYTFGKSSAQGAATSIYCCVEDGLKNGEFYSDCRLAPGYIRNKMFLDQDLANKLWEESAKLVGL